MKGCHGWVKQELFVVIYTRGCYTLVMVTTPYEAEKKTAKHSRKKMSKKARIILIIVGILVAGGAIAMGSYLYMKHLDQTRVDTARQEAQEVVKNPMDEWLLGGEDYVNYREALAREDEQAARRAYVNSEETDRAMKSSMCYNLFNAAMKASMQSDIQYASNCVDENGASLEVLDGMAKSYKKAGDAASARKYAEKMADIVRSLNLDGDAKSEMQESLKELGYDEKL